MRYLCFFQDSQHYQASVFGQRPSAWSWPAGRQTGSTVERRGIESIPSLPSTSMRRGVTQTVLAACGQRPRPAYVGMCVCANSKEMQTDHWRRGVSEDSGDGEQAQAPQTPTRPHCFHPHPHPHFIHPQHTSSPPAARESQPPLTPTPIAQLLRNTLGPGLDPIFPPVHSSQGRPPARTCLALRSLSRRLTMDTSQPGSRLRRLRSQRQRPAPNVAVGTAAAARGEWTGGNRPRMAP